LRLWNTLSTSHKHLLGEQPTRDPVESKDMWIGEKFALTG
jgi:hypothetical protein